MNTKGFQAYARELKEVHTQLKQCKDLMRQSKSNKESIQEKLKHNFDEMKEISLTLQKIKQDFSEWVEKNTHTIQQLQERITKLNDELVQQGRPFIDFSQSYEQLQKSNAWYSTDFRKMQSELFILALGVRKQFLYENHKSLKGAINVWERQPATIGKVNGDELITASWQWINFTVPVISTTFASFGRMFKNLHVDTVSNLFIDEAGQALPQASVGAVFRSKRIFAVGDPSQIKPVLTIPPSILTLISRHHDVNEKFISANASTQTIVDDASQFGYFKNKEEWIGIPLWVHRRCNDPMFTISNEISYNGLMVQGKDADSIGKAKWLHVEGKAIDKFVKEQAVRLKEEIQKMIEIDPKLKDDIYVISPFRNVAKKLENELNEINFVKKKGNKCVNVGTVHTFQGKEAKIVFFVLGADNDSRGAASWAVSEPNLMNVAVTRAKEQFYIIGDKKLYADLKSDVADKSIAILEAHNAL
ncbi:DEAD/DEAH box helicase [Kurthia senegalensis]|uniref:DEAD/DEAH box helicase n=1 Tax=Kurthia senegalensis TaxID=1033740 RepID=UPI00028813E6|nr:DEAD/DEAH box helicase [Kurthia senegalensis]